MLLVEVINRLIDETTKSKNQSYRLKIHWQRPSLRSFLKIIRPPFEYYMKDKFRSGLNTRVFEEYDRLKDAADSEHTRNRCKEAISLYGQALRLIDRSFGPAQKPGCLRQLAECYKQLGDFDKASKNLREQKFEYPRAIEILKDYRGVNDSEVTQAVRLEMRNAHSNLGLLELDEVEYLIENNKEGFPSRVFELLISSKRNLIEAHKITKQKLRSRHLYTNEWYEHYCSDLLNIVNIYMVEAENFEQQSCFEQILRLVNRAQRFYSIHYGEFKLKEVLSKCYYNKAIGFRFLKNYQEAQIYFKKDNAYCKKHQLANQLSKNKQEMVKLYSMLNQYDKAMQYVEENDHNKRGLVRDSRNNYKQYKVVLAGYQPSVLDFEMYVRISEYMSEFDQLDQLISMSRTLLKLHAQRLSKPQLFQVNYYLTDACYRLKKYDASMTHLQECMSLCNENSREQARVLMLKANILSQYEPGKRAKVQQAFKECIVLAERQKYRDLVELCNSNLRMYRDQQVYRKMDKPEISDDEDILQKGQPGFHFSREELVIDDTPSVRQQLPRKSRSQGVQYYREKCMKHKIPTNEYVINTILTRRPPGISNIANFSQKSLLVLVKALVKPTILDLSNNSVSDEFVEKLIGDIDKRKVDFSQLETLVLQSRLSRPQNLQKLLTKCSKLQTFKLSNLVNYTTLKTLKLKNCRITDSILQSVPFSEMKQLSSLNLKGNQLTGECFSSLNPLTQLLKLNLSDNRLGDSERTDLTLSVKKLVLKSTIFTNQLVNRLSSTLKFVETLDISCSANPRLLFEAMYNNYVSDHYILKIKELKVNRFTLTQQCFMYMSSFILSAPALVRLELMGVRETPDLVCSIVDCTLQNCKFIETVDIRRSHVPEGYKEHPKVLV